MMERYSPPNPNIWNGRIDKEKNSLRIHQVIKSLDLNSAAKYDYNNSIALLGFACDLGVVRNKGRAGAKHGPQAIRKKLASFPVHYHSQQLVLYDCGNIYCPVESESDNDPLQISQNLLQQYTKQLLSEGAFPIIMGGGHELALGHFMGIYSHIKQLSSTPKIGIINFDAHFDLRMPEPDNKGTSGTPFWQIAQNIGKENFNYLCLGIQKISNTPALFNTAHDLSVQYLSTDALNHSTTSTIAKVRQFIESVDYLYLTICLDGFSSSYAPGVSAPNSFGFTPHIIAPYLNTIMSSSKLIGFDVAELSPPFDLNGRTAQLAAHLIWQQIHCLTIQGMESES